MGEFNKKVPGVRLTHNRGDATFVCRVDHCGDSLFDEFLCQRHLGTLRTVIPEVSLVRVGDNQFGMASSGLFCSPLQRGSRTRRSVVSDNDSILIHGCSTLRVVIPTLPGSMASPRISTLRSSAAA